MKNSTKLKWIGGSVMAMTLATTVYVGAEELEAVKTQPVIVQPSINDDVTTSIESTQPPLSDENTITENTNNEDKNSEDNNADSFDNTNVQPVALRLMASMDAQPEQPVVEGDNSTISTEENNIEEEDPSKFYVEFRYKDYENLPKEVQNTLESKKIFETMIRYMLYSPKKPDSIDLGDIFWEFIEYTDERIGNKTIYTGIWEKRAKIDVTFEAKGTENLPEDLKSKVYEPVKVIEGKEIKTPENEEIVRDKTVWMLTWPKVIAGNENMTVTGVWSSRPISYNGTVKFVTKNGNQKVKFTSEDEHINHTDVDGNKANEGESGGGFSKGYFMLWSDTPNYNGTQKNAKLFYGHEAISRAFPSGITDKSTLYSVDLTWSTALNIASKLSGKAIINKTITPEETIYNELRVSKNDGNETVYYAENNLKDEYAINLGASFILSPYVTAAIRNHSGIWNYANMDVSGPANDEFLKDPENLKESMKDNKQKYTYIDLHVKLDPRLKLADTLNFEFKSYAFRPVVILKGDYSGPLKSEIITPEEDPTSTIKLETKDLEVNGRKDFVIRTRIRPKYSIPNATAEEAMKDMELINGSKDNFHISKEELMKILRGETENIKINGHIQGGASLREVSKWGITLGGNVDIPKSHGGNTAETKIIDFKPVYVNFDRNDPVKNNDENTATLGTTSFRSADNSTTNPVNSEEKNMGKSRVALNSSIDNDIFNLADKPVFNSDVTKVKIGETLPDPPTIDGYIFKGWNTKADGSGKVFDGNTVVTLDMLTDGEMTVYAQWSTKVYFNKNSEKIGDRSVQNLGYVEVKHNSSINEGRLGGLVSAPNTSLTGYNFKEWNTKADGSGEKLNLDSKISSPTTYYAVWENKPPILKVKDREIKVGDSLNLKDLIGYVSDEADKAFGTDLTETDVKIDRGTFTNEKSGEYEITFSVTDSAGATTIEKVKVTVINTPPELLVSDKIINLGENLDLRSLIKYVTDDGDKALGNNLKESDVIIKNPEDFNNKKPGEYEIQYEVSDSEGAKATAISKITVSNDKPVLTVVENKTIEFGEELDLSSLIVSVMDEGDKALGKELKKSDVRIINPDDFDNKRPGEYKIHYEIIDSLGAKVTATSTITVKDLVLGIINEVPVLEVEDRTIKVGESLDLKDLIKTITDKEEKASGKDLSKDDVTIKAGEFDNKKAGNYEIIFEVVDSQGAKITKKATVTVKNLDVIGVPGDKDNPIKPPVNNDKPGEGNNQDEDKNKPGGENTKEDKLDKNKQEIQKPNVEKTKTEKHEKSGVLGKKLPTTGSNLGKFSTSIAGIVGLLGFGILRRKKGKEN